ncbi:ComEA family DNA-binding protein [Terribacillus sp. DMT04]|uniref:ComEA family DNA-binding protein n=1 Tax=Terribacillus sp. DMT04 TaxID=2850441 RepID=UPI001C2BF862|nr:ComEA family DNA-binding protein [Terribacillus sp. DMT04]QXE00486.1 ComEA family DNA-binding protein [Terribacillus sp. DMT04]
MQILKQYSWLILLAAVAAVFLFSRIPKQETEPVMQPAAEADAELERTAAAKETSAEETGEAAVMVDIKGEVKNPGVYELASGSRVEKAIEAAGGLTEKAELRSINLAQKVKDEQMIYVAAIGEASSAAAIQTPGTSDASEKININQADVKQLTEIKGVGEAKAQAIISYREENGPFTSIDQLTEVSGIGEKSLENMKDQVSL